MAKKNASSSSSSSSSSGGVGTRSRSSSSSGTDQQMPPAQKTWTRHRPEDVPDVSMVVACMVYFNYFILASIGHIRDMVAKFTGISRFELNKHCREGYCNLFNAQESFYVRRVYGRLQDCWNRPLTSGPGVYVNVMSRKTQSQLKGNHMGALFKRSTESVRCMNLGSYNYLGFADDWKETCRDEVVSSVDHFPNSMTSSPLDFGTTSMHKDLEETVARFVGKEAAVVFPMGFNTNAATVPCLMGSETLIISDALNHTSIVNGARGCRGAQIRVFRHNEASHLAEVLREAIVKGQPKHHRPWKKILVMVEGIYSMEGNLCNLADVVKVCKQYKAFLWVDEAHSIGALGKTGRGICEHQGVDPKDVDILMGTFTKSFSGMGGYIAASKEVVDFIRTHSPGVTSHNAISPVVTQQVITAFRVIMGEDGSDVGRRKLDDLNSNSNYFRKRLVEMGMHVYGDEDSPIVPMLIYFPGKVAAFSRECLARGLAVVVVGFPATSVIYSRARFCVSAGHTREDVDKALAIIEEVSDLLGLRYNR